MEYAQSAEALKAIKNENGNTMYDQEIQCDFAFIRPKEELVGIAEKSKQHRGRGGKSFRH